MNEKDIFVMNLKNLMHEYNLSKQGLADKLDCSVSLVTNVLNGNKEPSMHLVMLTCQAFGVSAARMFTPDERQFKFKQNTANADNESLIEYLNSRIKELEDENCNLRNDISAYQLSCDNLDNKVRIICKEKYVGGLNCGRGKVKIVKNNVEIPIDSYIHIDGEYYNDDNIPTGWEVLVRLSVDAIEI